MTINDYCEMMGYDAVITMNDYDKAFIGFTTDGHAVYDYDLLVECLMESSGLDAEEAVDWVEYNTLRALEYIDISARPVVVHKINLQEEA